MSTQTPHDFFIPCLDSFCKTNNSIMDKSVEHAGDYIAAALMFGTISCQGMGYTKEEFIEQMNHAWESAGHYIKQSLANDN